LSGHISFFLRRVYPLPRETVMRALAAILAFIAAPAGAGTTPADLIPGVYTNDEDVYFAKDAGRTPPVETRIAITRDRGGFRLTAIDPFGKPTDDGIVLAATEGPTLNAGPCAMPFRPDKGVLVALPRTGACRNQSIMERFDLGGLTLRLGDGTTTMLRRARPVTCWAAMPKEAKKADGSTDWYGVRDLALHDQGGRAAFGGGETGAKAATIKIRNVVWPTGPNKPSVVLYVYTPDAPDTAVAYSWADPGATRVGINLRWMQASCTIG
jgi:hypothetical protein